MFHIPFHSTRPITTAHLAQTMTLLSLTASELQQQIDAELAANPALEILDEKRCPTCRRLLPQRGICPVCSKPNQTMPDEPIVFISTREVEYYGGLPAGEDNGDEFGSAASDDLPTYVLRQIAPDLQAEDRKLAAYLLTHLNEDGLLTVALLEVAMYFHVPVSRLETLKRIIQRADPIGVGSFTPREALLVQLDVLAETTLVPELAKILVDEHLDALSRRQYSDLARGLHVPVEKIRSTAQFISENLNPYPGRSSWGDVRNVAGPHTDVYYRPDIIIGRLDNSCDSPLVIEILFPLGGTLRVNPLYREAVQQAVDDQKGAMREDLERASLFVKCLQQRNHTMQRLLQRMAVLQRDFIIKGSKHLKSITRASLAKELDVHESTISRAVANKAVQLPNGRIIPLADFFDRSLSARVALKELISFEKKPLSDSELVALMAQRGFEVARRTVAKYRAMEGILPAHLRQPCRAGYG
jgi:RNA polymerase sigma-54 factor